MNFGRINSGAKAGFVAGALSGPIYGLTVLFISSGDVFDVDSSFGAGLFLGLPTAILFGCVLAGLPGILFGMAMGASIGDRPMLPSVSAWAIAVGSIAGIALLQSVNDVALGTAVVIRGVIVGAISAYIWIRIFDFLRTRSPAVIVLDDEPA